MVLSQLSYRPIFKPRILNSDKWRVVQIKKSIRSSPRGSSTGRTAGGGQGTLADQAWRFALSKPSLKSGRTEAKRRMRVSRKVVGMT